MDDVLSRTRLLRLLVALLETDPEPQNAGQLEAQTGYDYQGFARLREDALEWGLITVEKTSRGRIPVDLHHLTPGGRRVAKHALAAEQEAKKTREEAHRKKSR